MDNVEVCILLILTCEDGCVHDLLDHKKIWM